MQSLGLQQPPWAHEGAARGQTNILMPLAATESAPATTKPGTLHKKNKPVEVVRRSFCYLQPTANLTVGERPGEEEGLRTRGLGSR